jgi:Cu(I)/Ag(I) efflux system membrane fusion protein
MQLSGKPSLIDATRAIAKSQERQGPLRLENVAVKPIAGEAGDTLERLYQAYFQVQQALAADEKPSPDAVEELHQAATQLSNDPELPDAGKLRDIAAGSEHLHHMELAEARKAFKPISHAIVTLAAEARSEDAQGSFQHFYCPMVPGGGGDWLQADDNLLNPYFGSEMLRCGEKVAELPPKSEPAAKAPAGDENGPPPSGKET